MNRNRLIGSALLAMVLLCITGCPTGPAAVAAGVWVLEYDQSNTVLGIALFGDGSVLQPVPLPPEADASFAGVMSWEQNGSQFILKWTAVGTFVFVAQVNDSDNLAGTWVEVDTGNTGAWSARRVG